MTYNIKGGSNYALFAENWRDSSTFFEGKLSGNIFTYSRNCFLKKLSYLSDFLYMLVTGKNKKSPDIASGENFRRKYYYV